MTLGTVLFWLLTLGLAFLGGNCWGIRARRVRKIKQELVLYRERYLKVSGRHEEFGDYEIRSFDGGRLWYATSLSPSGQVIIRGTAKAVYPGLLEELKNWDKLVEVISRHGPLGSDRAVTSEERVLLKNLQLSPEPRRLTPREARR